MHPTALPPAPSELGLPLNCHLLATCLPLACKLIGNLHTTYLHWTHALVFVNLQNSYSLYEAILQASGWRPLERREFPWKVLGLAAYQTRSKHVPQET
jgi:hypothetical protein